MNLDTLADGLRRVTVEVAGGGNGVGSGVVVAPEWVVTNAHVVRERNVTVRLADGRCVHGRVVAGDGDADLAALHVPDLGTDAATLADSQKLRVGARVIAIGHPLGVRGAVTTGIVHAVAPIGRGGPPWIQADLRLAPGNSGGPLADARGRLVGLNSRIVGGLALAIPESEV